MIYLKVDGFDSQIEGTFAFKIDKFDKASAIAFPVDNKLTTSISAGEVKLYAVNLLKNVSYTFSMTADEFTGAYGDGVDAFVSSFSGNTGQTYFNEERPHVPAWWDGVPNNQKITPIADEKVYLAIMGAYWWKPRSITIVITENKP